MTGSRLGSMTSTSPPHREPVARGRDQPDSDGKEAKAVTGLSTSAAFHKTLRVTPAMESGLTHHV